MLSRWYALGILFRLRTSEHLLSFQTCSMKEVSCKVFSIIGFTQSDYTHGSIHDSTKRISTNVLDLKLLSICDVVVVEVVYHTGNNVLVHQQVSSGVTVQSPLPILTACTNAGTRRERRLICARTSRTFSLCMADLVRTPPHIALTLHAPLPLSRRQNSMTYYDLE